MRLSSGLYGGRKYNVRPFVCSSREIRPQCAGRVYRCIVENHGQRLAHVFDQQAQKSDEQHRGHRLTQLHCKQPSRGQQCSDHVQTLAAPGVNHVLLPEWRPGTSIRLRSREARFVYVGEFDFATLGSLDQRPDLRLGLSEPLFVPLFFRLCRVRLHTSPARLRSPRLPCRIA